MPGLVHTQRGYAHSLAQFALHRAGVAALNSLRRAAATRASAGAGSRLSTDDPFTASHEAVAARASTNEPAAVVSSTHAGQSWRTSQGNRTTVHSNRKFQQGDEFGQALSDEQLRQLADVGVVWDPVAHNFAPMQCADELRANGVSIGEAERRSLNGIDGSSVAAQGLWSAPHLVGSGEAFESADNNERN